MTVTWGPFGYSLKFSMGYNWLTCDPHVIPPLSPVLVYIFINLAVASDDQEHFQYKHACFYSLACCGSVMRDMLHMSRAHNSLTRRPCQK